MKPKVFTLEEANHSLPHLSPRLQSLQEKKHNMLQMHDQLLTLELLQEDAKDFYETKDGQEYLQQSSSLESLIVSFENDIQEIAALGCILRDIEKGIIDFYHVCNKELIFLNWVLGEASVAYWHELDASFLDRNPLSELASKQT